LSLVTPRTALAQAGYDAGNERYERLTLPNGLRVQLAEDHRAPLVAIIIRYPVGPLHDPADGRGLGSGLVVSLPPAQADAARGTVTLYRASHAAADRIVPLALDVRGEQRVPVAGLESGRWIVKLAWQVQGRRYYREEAVQVP